MRADASFFYEGYANAPGELSLNLNDGSGAGRRADLLGCCQEARQYPESVAQMRTRHVLGDRGMCRGTAERDHLDGGLRDPDLDDLTDY